MSKSYTVLKGINYVTTKGDVRAEPGDVVTDIPEKSITVLKFKKAIVEVSDVPVAKKAKKATKTPADSVESLEEDA